MKYEGPNTYQTRDMANVKVFANKETEKRTSQKRYAPIYRCRGIKKSFETEMGLKHFNQMTKFYLHPN